MGEERRDILRRIASIDRAVTVGTASLSVTPNEEFKAGFDAGWEAAMAQEGNKAAPPDNTP